MKWLSAALAAFVLCSAAIAIGCGQSEEEKREQARQEAAEKRAIKEKRERIQQQAAHDRCEEAFADLQNAVEEMGSRLNIGLNYGDYTSGVADIRVVYDQADFADMEDIECISGVGIQLEKAMNQYAKAATRWDECFEDIYCENDSIQGELQGYWGKAGGLAAKADAALTDMQPSGD